MQAHSYKIVAGMTLQLLVSSTLMTGLASADQLAGGPIPLGEGFYKDVLIDGGPGISASPTRHFESLELSYEKLSYKAFDVTTGEKDEEDRAEFVQKFIGSEIDLNGRLLYPDGAPRYRMLNIGAASFLGSSSSDGGGSVHSALLRQNFSPLQRTGAQHVQDFVANGGGYVGFCAGALIAGASHNDLRLYPGQTYPLPDSSATVYLKDIFNEYLGFREVPNVMSQGGGYIMRTRSSQYPYNYEYPEGVEIQGNADGYPAVWSWQDPDNPFGGTLVLSGRHPELSLQERSEALTKAMYELAIKGTLGEYEPKVRIKGELESGQTRYMNEETGHYNSSYIKIGDKQYHHFKINVDDPRKKYLTIELNGEYGYDFNLYLKRGKPAFASNADWALTDAGSYKELKIDNLSYGEWYVSVELATTVETDRETNSEYSGPLEVLNGLAYDITATWDSEQPCTNTISNVSVANPAFIGQKLPISWHAECFEADSRASVVLVNANDGAKVASITNNGSLNDGTNGLTWNVTYSQPGRYMVRVSDNRHPDRNSLSQAFDLKKPVMLIAPPVSLGEKLSVIWRWTGENSHVSLDLYQGSNLVQNLKSNIAQQNGANNLEIAANWTWIPGAEYRVRIRTLDRGTNKTYFSPSFKPMLNTKVTVGGLDINHSGEGEVMLDGCNPGKKCSRALTFTSEGQLPANIDLQFSYVDDVFTSTTAQGQYDLASSCIRNSSSGRYTMYLPAAATCRVDLTYSWPAGESGARRAYLSLHSLDSDIQLPFPGQKGVNICANCR